MGVRLLEELTDLERLALIDVSYSRLDTFFGKDWGCQAKYFYTYITKEERQFGAAATLGNVVHTALENKLERGKKIEAWELIKEYDTQLKEYDPDHKIDDQLRQAGREMIFEFVDRHEGQTFPIESKEQSFAIVVGNGLISGYIDRIDIYKHRLVIIDYKTGKKEVAQKNIANDLQLGIYALAMDKMYPGHEIYASLYYLRTGRQKGHSFTKSDLESVEKRLLSMINQLADTRDFHPTANERMCNYCDFNNGVCPTGTSRVTRFRG